MTPLADIPVPGEKITFGDLEVTFMVDENLENFREIHGKLMGLGFQNQELNLKILLMQVQIDFLYKASQKETEQQVSPVPMGPVFSDATLNVLSSKNRSNIEVRFNDVFLTGLNFNQCSDDVQYLQPNF